MEAILVELPANRVMWLLDSNAKTPYCNALLSNHKDVDCHLHELTLPAAFFIPTHISTKLLQTTGEQRTWEGSAVTRYPGQGRSPRVRDHGASQTSERDVLCQK